MDWNPAQYLKFEHERTQPARDLANRVDIDEPKLVLDLGCGPGNSSMVLKQRFPHARILGVDSSPDMIKRAQASFPDIEFRLFDATDDFSVLGSKWDVLFSNACLQWIPDHHSLLPRLMQALRPGGVLAVQVPMQSKSPVHRLMRELAQRPDRRKHLSGIRPFHLLTAIDYCDILMQCAASFSIWETDYFHILPSHRAILEWYRATGLRPYLTALPEFMREEFEQDLLKGVEASFPALKNDSVLFPFPRLFFVAKKQAL